MQFFSFLMQLSSTNNNNKDSANIHYFKIKISLTTNMMIITSFTRFFSFSAFIIIKTYDKSYKNKNKNKN